MQEREILFRGKTYDGKWEQGDLRHGGYVHNDSETYIMRADYALHNIPVDPKTVGQYTGLTDKNGVKIFEGDIVSNEWCLISGNSVVKFGEYRGSYMSKEYQQGHYGFHLEHLDPSEEAITRKDMMYFANRCEVIGNIHDNSEFLEVK